MANTISRRLRNPVLTGLLWLPLAAASGQALASGAGLQLMKLSTATYPTAVCNDGTPGAVVMRLNPASTRWVIELQGGGACATVAQCAARPPKLSSSSGYLTGTQFQSSFAGILSNDPAVNPTFATANQVLLPYCSSDYWSGAADPAGGIQPFYFQGRAIVLAAVQTLLAMPGGLATATDVLFTGSSAGGIGVILDANDILPLMPAGIATLIATDAAYSNNFPAYDENAPPTYEASLPFTPYEAAYFVVHPLWGGRGDRLCDPALYYLCYSTSYLISIGEIPGPIFVSVAQKDVVQLAYNGLGPNDTSAPATIFADEFGAAMNALLVASWPTTSVFSPNARLHEEITSDVLYSLPTAFAGGTTTLSQAIAAWYAAPGIAVKNIQ